MVSTRTLLKNSLNRKHTLSPLLDINYEDFDRLLIKTFLYTQHIYSGHQIMELEKCSHLNLNIISYT